MSKNNAKIQKVSVEIGENKKIELVCGDLTLKPNERVAVALAGSTVRSPNKGKNKIKKSKVHGIVSEGMLCSGLELGKNSDHGQIYRLEESVKIGDLVEVNWN